MDGAVTIYNVLGQLVRRYPEKYYPAGNFEFDWDMKDNYGNQVQTGVYIVRFKAEGFNVTKKCTVVRQ